MISLAVEPSSLFPRCDRFSYTGSRAWRWPFPLTPVCPLSEWQVFMMSGNHAELQQHSLNTIREHTAPSVQQRQDTEVRESQRTDMYVCRDSSIHFHTGSFTGLHGNNWEPCDALWTFTRLSSFIFFALNEYRWAAGSINGTAAVFRVITLSLLLYLLSLPSRPVLLYNCSLSHFVPPPPPLLCSEEQFCLGQNSFKIFY